MLPMISPRGVNDPWLHEAANCLAAADLVLLAGKKLDFSLRFGLEKFVWYFNEVAALPFNWEGDFDTLVDTINETGFGVIGDPDDAIAQIARLWEHSGGFGCFLQMVHNWADFAQPKRS